MEFVEDNNLFVLIFFIRFLFCVLIFPPPLSWEGWRTQGLL
jgi:hypothetical protein